MKKRIVTIVLVLMSTLFILIPQISEAKAFFAMSSEKALIDLFTSKEPYNGMGLNEPSDAFAPQEEVVLYAYVTYNLYPVENKLVTFETHGPPNPLQNITVSKTAITNASGMATVGFGIPWPAENPETIVFGVWSVCAYVEITEEVIEDVLTFKVGWILEILSSVTINKYLQPQTKFAKETCVGVELAFRNIAMINKTTEVSVVAFDNLSQPIANAVLDDLKIEPGEALIFAPCILEIPEWAAIGNATVHVNAFTPLGGLYCPEFSTAILITLLGDLNEDGIVDMKDLATAARAFGSYPGHPRWDLRSDINQDGKVDMRDLAMIARNFGKKDC